MQDGGSRGSAGAAAMATGDDAAAARPLVDEHGGGGSSSSSQPEHQVVGDVESSSEDATVADGPSSLQEVTRPQHAAAPATSTRTWSAADARHAAAHAEASASETQITSADAGNDGGRRGHVGVIALGTRGSDNDDDDRIITTASDGRPADDGRGAGAAAWW